MAYKVLGQTASTAATASTVVNLIKDPSFEGITRGLIPHTSASATVWSQVAGTQWYWQNQDSAQVSNDYCGDISQNASYNYLINRTCESRYGSKVIAFGCTSAPGTYSTSNYLQYGLSNTTDGQLTTTARFGGINNSIPVTAGTTYYYGLDAIGQVTTSTMKILWFNSSGTYLSTTSSNLDTTMSTSVWTRMNFSVAAPANAAYAGIIIQMGFYRNNGIAGAIDGVYFSTSSATATTFPDPSTGGTNSTLTAPFTSRYSSTWSGTANNSTTVTNYAGATVDLYTVPAGKSTVVSTITVTNPTSSSTAFRIAVVPSGETLALKHWIAFDIPLTTVTTQTLTLGLTLNAGDVIKVASDSSNTVFSAFGSEN